MSKKWINILSAAVILLAVFGAGYAVGDPGHREAHRNGGHNELEGEVGVLVDSGNATDTFTVEVGGEASVFEILRAAEEGGKVVFEYQDYGGELGAFVESINGARGEGNAWWQFWVNTTYSTVGVSQAYVEEGDMIIFKLTDQVNE